MNKYVQMIGGRIFDIALSKDNLGLSGFSVFLIIAVIVLITAALILIKRASDKNAETGKNPESSDPSDEAE